MYMYMYLQWSLDPIKYISHNTYMIACTRSCDSRSHDKQICSYLDPVLQTKAFLFLIQDHQRLHQLTFVVKANHMLSHVFK